MCKVKETDAIVLYDVKLTYKELLLLDKQVSTTAQETIDKAKVKESIPFDLPLMRDVVVKALEKGEFNWRTDSMSSCKYCDKKAGYHPHARNSKYHTKGKPNYNKPKTYRGYKFVYGGIIITGTADICSDCIKEYDVINRIVTYILEQDLPIQLSPVAETYCDVKTKYIKDDKQICYSCAKDMYESDMVKLPALMGGYYPGGCPHCLAQSLPFGNSHRTTLEYRMKKVE